VKEVWVGGRQSVSGGEVTNVDVGEIIGRSRELSQKLVATAGLS
jgi:hypothetical protein